MVGCWCDRGVVDVVFCYWDVCGCVVGYCCFWVVLVFGCWVWCRLVMVCLVIFRFRCVLGLVVGWWRVGCGLGLVSCVVWWVYLD